MKRVNNLYSKICSIENLNIAYNKAKKGKTKTYGVKLYEKELDSNLKKLNEELTSFSYKTSEYSIFTITDPKERIVYRLPFKDRIVHHAIMNVLEPIWVSVFTADTYSCIKGRGIHSLLNKLKFVLKNVDSTTFCLKLDIKKFYPSIDHDILKFIIRKKIKDKNLLNLLDEIIDSAPGVPIGNYLSQFFANLYLSYFDHWLKENKKIKYYYRYADDIVILSNNKSYLHNIFADIKEYMGNNLKLSIKSNYQIFKVESRGIDFVGYKFFHTHILLRKSIKQNICRKAAKLNKKDISVQIYKNQISPNLGWAIHCNSKNLLKKIIKKEVHEEIF